MSQFIFVYITNSSTAEAKKVALHLLNKKLIACANIYDNVDSFYPWEGKIAEEQEVVLIGKTLERNYQTIIEEVEKIHSYSVPCITKINVEPNEKYAQWLLSSLK